MGKFYVYEHWRPDKDVCFYVGKGSGRRAYTMGRRNDRHVKIQAKLAKLGIAVEVRIIESSLSEEDAWELEIKRIALWSSQGHELANMSIGGEGPAGRPGLRGPAHPMYGKPSIFKGRKHTDAARAALSAYARGRKNRLGARLSDETKEKIAAARRGKVSPTRGIPKSAEQRAKISASVSEAIRGEKNPFFGRKHSEETKRKISEAKKAQGGRKHTAETRKKLSDAWTRRRERMRCVNA